MNDSKLHFKWLMEGHRRELVSGLNQPLSEVTPTVTSAVLDLRAWEQFLVDIVVSTHSSYLPNQISSPFSSLRQRKIVIESLAMPGLIHFSFQICLTKITYELSVSCS